MLPNFCITLLFLKHFYHMIYKFVFKVVIFMQMLIYNGLCDLTIWKNTTSLTMIDDCGNKWNCITIFGSRPHRHVKLSRGWKRMVLARRLEECVMVKVGFSLSGMNDTIYIQLKRPTILRVWFLQCNWWSSVFRVYVDGSISMFLNYLFKLMKFMPLSLR